MMKQIFVFSALLATFCDGRYSFQQKHGSYLGKKENHFSHKLPGKSFMSVSTSYHHPPPPPPPVDCEWSEWKISSQCSVTCGSGTQTWTRQKIEHQPHYHYQRHHHHHPDELNHYDHHHHYDHNDHHGHKKRSAHGWKKTYHTPVGKECIGEPTKTEICHMKPCPINCELSEWSEWSECPACGNATQSFRTRTIEKESKYGGTCDTNRFQTRDCNPPKCPNALPTFSFVDTNEFDAPVISVTFPRYFLDTESPRSGRRKRSTSDRLQDLVEGIEFKKEYENREAIETYGAVDTMDLAPFAPAAKLGINDIFIGNLTNEPDAPVTATIHQESGYMEFSIFSERNVGTNLFIWFYGNGTVKPIDEPFANGEVDKIDGDIDDDDDNEVTSVKRKKGQNIRARNQVEVPQSARLQVKVAYDESFKEQMKGDITAIEKYWLRAQAHLQALFCLPSFNTKVEIERVDDIKHFKRTVHGANEDVTEEQKNVTEERKKFTEENLDGNADLLVYMAVDNTPNANQPGDTIGRAYYRAVCNTTRTIRRNAHSVTEWNEHTHYFGGVVAHEIAHNMGIRHDFQEGMSSAAGEGQCAGEGFDESIMNYNAHKSKWSKCSVFDFGRAYDLYRNRWCMDFEINDNRCEGIRERKPRIEIIGPTFNYATGEIAPGEIIIHNNTDTFDPAVEIAGGINRLYSDSAGNITIF